MEDYYLVIFIAPRVGDQFFFLCPPSIMTYWDDFVDQHPDGTADQLAEWVNTVPPVLKSKVLTYKGEYVKFNHIGMSKLKVSKGFKNELILVHGHTSKSTIFNPFAMAKSMASPQPNKK